MLLPRGPKVDWTPHHVEVWYDRHSKSWVVQLMNVSGYQIDTAVYVHSKREALAQRDLWQAQITTNEE